MAWVYACPLKCGGGRLGKVRRGLIEVPDLGQGVRGDSTGGLSSPGLRFSKGWAWLVKNSSGELNVVDTHDAANPIAEGLTPLLTCDVWEHAYYIDYKCVFGALCYALYLVTTILLLFSLGSTIFLWHAFSQE